MTSDAGESAGALSEFVTIFEGVRDSVNGSRSDADALAHALNGQPGVEIRRLVSVGERRRMGAFFTPHELADELAVPLRSARGRVTVFDPCCGAGDLLLAAARALEDPVRGGAASASVVGLDIVDEFARVARMRFEMLACTLGLNMTGHFNVGDGLAAPGIGNATHVLVNPPFATVPSRENCQWAGGRVNGAADFLAHFVAGLEPGVQISAILPDVLRSGARYRPWRNHITQRLDLDAPEPKGRFDPWTDVDVFILRGSTRSMSTVPSPCIWGPSAVGPTVGDRFDVSVGPLVDYRSPLEGPLVPYLVAKDFPAWGTIAAVERTRQFSGRLHQGPFVVIPRTSRPGDPYRARAAVVAVVRRLAVENHLIVLKPRRGGMTECRRLIRRLQSRDVDDWLDRVIRCRHLTVGAVASIPWAPGPGRAP